MLLSGGAQVAWAGCPNGHVLKKIGGVATSVSTAVVSTQGQDVHAILADCSGTACTFGAYNADSLPDASTAAVVFEVGGAANTSVFLDLTNSPLYFSEGITVVDESLN